MSNFFIIQVLSEKYLSKQKIGIQLFVKLWVHCDNLKKNNLWVFFYFSIYVTLLFQCTYFFMRHTYVFEYS